MAITTIIINVCQSILDILREAREWIHCCTLWCPCRAAWQTGRWGSWVVAVSPVLSIVDCSAALTYKGYSLVIGRLVFPVDVFTLAERMSPSSPLLISSMMANFHCILGCCHESIWHLPPSPSACWSLLFDETHVAQWGTLSSIYSKNVRVVKPGLSHFSLSLWSHHMSDHPVHHLGHCGVASTMQQMSRGNWFNIIGIWWYICGWLVIEYRFHFSCHGLEALQGGVRLA